MLETYHIASTIMLAFVACIWSSSRLPNLLIKFGFLLVAISGCIICAKDIFL